MPSASAADAAAPSIRWRWRTGLALMTASGAAALGYQIVWTQQAALWLGQETAAVLAVVAALFGGLAVGALLLGPRIAVSARPLAWYVGCEVLIGTWAALLAFALAPAADLLLRLTGAEASPVRQWTVAFAGTFVVLLPATAAMGATLPAMERLLAPWRSAGRAIAPLYAANTFGAVVGVLAAALWLVPAVGLLRTALLCALLNGLVALAAVMAFGGPKPAAQAMPRVRPIDTGVLAALAFAGLLGIGLEVLVVRALAQLTENTVYTFALLLAVYLVGSAIGAAAQARWRWSRSTLLALMTGAALLSVLALAAAPSVYAALRPLAASGLAAALGVELALAALAFLPPTLVMGALFCQLAADAQAQGHTLGRVLGVNTLGAALAPALFGVLLLPAFGLTAALLLVAAGYLALLFARSWRRPLPWALGGAALLLAVLLPSLAVVDLPPGGRLVSLREGVGATVSVVEDGSGSLRLHLNNRAQEGSTGALLASARVAQLPWLLHPEAHTALFLGLGTGISAHIAAQDAALQVHAVELLPEVVDAAPQFATRVFGAAAVPRLQVQAADARRYVRASPLRYDLIVADNMHPARSGAGALYTVEHFRAVRARLAPDGLFCQWLPLHQMELDTLRSIVASFLVAYPDGWLVLAGNSLATPVIGLVARADGARFDPAAVRARLAVPLQPVAPQRVGLTDELAVLGSVAAGPAALARWAAGAPLNTDDRPVVAYAAPLATYAPRSTPAERLLDLLAALSVQPAEVVTGADAQWTARLAAYWRARDRFLSAGRAVAESTDAQRMLAQVQAPLLEVLAISPDFRPAYEPLLRLAAAVADTDGAGAVALLQALQKVAPQRPEAAALLDALGTGASP